MTHRDEHLRSRMSARALADDFKPEPVTRRIATLIVPNGVLGGKPFDGHVNVSVARIRWLERPDLGARA